MRKDIDILLNEDGDLLLDESGEPVVGDVTQQNQKLIISTNKGDWKVKPLVGVGAEDYINDEGNGGLMREIRLQLKQDGLTINSIGVLSNKIKVDARYI
jgi:glucuronate isomerase